MFQCTSLLNYRVWGPVYIAKRFLDLSKNVILYWPHVLAKEQGHEHSQNPSAFFSSYEYFPLCQLKLMWSSLQEFQISDK